MWCFEKWWASFWAISKRVAKFDTQAKVFQPLSGGVISKLDVSPSTFFCDHTVLIFLNFFCAPCGNFFYFQTDFSKTLWIFILSWECVYHLTSWATLEVTNLWNYANLIAKYGHLILLYFAFLYNCHSSFFSLLLCLYLTFFTGLLAGVSVGNVTPWWYMTQLDAHPLFPNCVWHHPVCKATETQVVKNSHHFFSVFLGLGLLLKFSLYKITQCFSEVSVQLHCWCL